MEDLFTPETEAFLSFEKAYAENARSATEPSSDAESSCESESEGEEPTAQLSSDIDVEQRREERKFTRDTCGCKLGSKGNPCSNQFPEGGNS